MLSDVIDTLGSISHADIERVAARLTFYRQQGHTLLLAGNGGSLSTLRHFKVDLARACPDLRTVIPNGAEAFSAASNDGFWIEYYKQFFRPFCGPQSGLLLVTTSAQSKNLVELNRFTRERGGETILITSKQGAAQPMAEDSDITIILGEDSIRVIETAHYAFLMNGVIEILFQGQPTHAPRADR